MTVRAAAKAPKMKNGAREHGQEETKPPFAQLPVYTAAGKSRDRYRILYGGAGSGKSVFVAGHNLAMAVRLPGERILTVRKTARSCRISTFTLYKDLIHAWRWPAEINKSDLTISFANGSQILHAGLDDAEKLKSVAGVTRIWVEEATELAEDDFNQVNLRLRGVAPERCPQVTLTFNPISTRHWIKRRFVDAPSQADIEAGVFVQQTTFRDNPYVGGEYESALEGLPEHMREVYMEGEWGTVVKGLIYPEWRTYETPPEADVVYGLDFGYHAPSALVEVRRRDAEDDTAGIYAKLLFYESGLTNQDIAAKLEGLGLGGATIYADSAEPKSIDEIRRAGIRGIKPADKGPDSVRGGCTFVRGQGLHIHKSSQEMMNEAEMYRWATDRDGNPLNPERPDKGADHAMDAMRYAAYTHWGKRKRWSVA